jgi:hypothetical protein
VNFLHRLSPDLKHYSIVLLSMAIPAWPGTHFRASGPNSGTQPRQRRPARAGVPGDRTRERPARPGVLARHAPDTSAAGVGAGQRRDHTRGLVRDAVHSRFLQRTVSALRPDHRPLGPIRPAYWTCWLTSLASSNIEMDGFPPKMGCSMGSALIRRLSWASCRPWALM